MSRGVPRFGLALLLLTGCGTAEEAAPQNNAASGGKADDAGSAQERAYAFLPDNAFTEARDHAGAPLLATIWGRIDEYSQEAPFVDRKAYNDSDGSTGLPWPAHIVARYKLIHDSWTPSLEEMGLDVCDEFGLTDDEFFAGDGVDFDALAPEQCFGQRVQWPNPETGIGEPYRRVIEIALPDYLTLEIDEPSAFPNGRVLHEQINSLMFAMAFLDHRGSCTSATEGDGAGAAKTECDLHTLWRRSDFLKRFNDVPFAGATEVGEPARVFPFLGAAHRIR